MPEEEPALGGSVLLAWQRNLTPLPLAVAVAAALVSEGALGRSPSSRGSGAALPTSQGWSCFHLCHPHRKSVLKVSSARKGRTRSQQLSGTLVCDKSSLH